MAFLIDRGIAAESEDEFDAEADRYEELKSKLLGGQTMKNEETEELLAAAEARGDQKTVDALKNAAGAVTESEKEPTKAELLDKLIKMCEPGSGVRNALEEIKDKFALDESSTYVQDGSDLDAAGDELWKAIDRLVERKDLAADECEWDAKAGVLVLTYREIGWYEGHAATDFGPAALAGFAEEVVEDDVESDLAKIRGELLESGGFGFEFARGSVKAAIDAAAERVRKDGDDAVGQKENRFGDWDYVADCVVRIPCRLTYGPARAGGVREEEELLPDCVVNEAVETLRRMY